MIKKKPTKGMYRCIVCSTVRESVFVKPRRSGGYLTCPKCGSIELQKVL